MGTLVRKIKGEDKVSHSENGIARYHGKST